MENFSVLLIDDDESQIEYLASLISVIPYPECEVFTALSAAQGLEIVEKHNVNLVITDYLMPDCDGHELLKKIKRLNPNIDVIILTANTDTKEAVKTMKSGAYDYFIKPLRADALESVLIHLVEKQNLIRENRILRQQFRDSFASDTIVSESEEIQNVLNTAFRSAQSSATILINGESGTGKELVARTIHQASDRKDMPFVVVHIAALPETLIESELFGHRRGSFTGATEDRIGRFEQAHRGTLFIDEIGEIPPSIQVKLLRVLQFGEFEKLGDTRSTRVDVRILAASNRNLEEMVRQHKFRLDLYYRLNVISIPIPPLRKHKADIPKLVEHFIGKYAFKNNKKIDGISQEALDQLMKYNYPGNIRELENIIERAIVLSRSSYITIHDLPPQIEMKPRSRIFDPHDLKKNYEDKLKSFEREMILKALAENSGNQTNAADMLGISERRLRYRMEKLSIRNPKASHA